MATLENDLNTIEGKNNATNRFSIIDMGECENMLRESYNLNKKCFFDNCRARKNFKCFI